MRPPIGGPRIGPIKAGTRYQFIADTMSCLSTLRRSTRRPTGIIIAPPAPCKSRARTSIVKLGAWAHRTEPPVKIAIAEKNTVRAPNLSARLPLAGMRTARLKR